MLCVVTGSEKGNQPCLCLCLGFSQMTMILPFLLMILHFSQIFLTDGFTFICDYHAFLKIQVLLGSPGDAALVQVVDRDFDGYAITGENADIVHAQLARDVSGHYVAVGQAHLEGSVGKSLHNLTLKFNDIILRHEEFPLLYLSCNATRSSEILLDEGQIDDAVSRQRYGILVVSRQRAVCGLDRPAVGKFTNRLGADIDHRLNGYDQTGAESCAAARGSVVGNVRGFVKLTANAVTDVTLDSGKTVCHDQTVDGCANVSQPTADLKLVGAGEEGGKA